MTAVVSSGEGKRGKKRKKTKWSLFFCGIFYDFTFEISFDFDFMISSADIFVF